MNREPFSPLLWLRASFAISTTSIWRLILTWQTAICMIVLALLSGLALIWGIFSEGSRAEFVQIILMAIYTGIFVPLVAICFGTAAIGRERDSQTLVYLITTPTPRPLVYLAKFTAAIAVALAWTCGGYILLLCVAGVAKMDMLMAYLPAIFLGTIAYVALFQLLSVLIRFPTIVAFLYAVFLQNLVGLMPGTTKRIAVSFYVQSMIMDASKALKILPERETNPEIFVPLAGDTAMLAIVGITLGLLAFGSYVFWRKEYV